MNEQTATEVTVTEPIAPVTEEVAEPDYKAMYEALRREHDILLQNAETAARAPVRGVSGGAPAELPVDDFIRGFDSDTW